MNLFSTSGTILVLKHEGERQLAISLGTRARKLAQQFAALLGLSSHHGAGETQCR